MSPQFCLYKFCSSFHMLFNSKYLPEFDIYVFSSSNNALNRLKRALWSIFLNQNENHHHSLDLKNLLSSGTEK